MTRSSVGTLLRRPDVLKWLALGLLIRLIVMPITTHSDLLSVYQRAHLILDGRTVAGLGPNLLNTLHAGFLWVMSPFLTSDINWADFRTTSVGDQDWLPFLSSPRIFRTLFFFKLPYLVFEALAVWVLFNLIEPERVGRVAAFWMLNPVVIFSTYIFGRFDIIIVWLLLSSLFFARASRANVAMLILGFAALVRMYPIILVLPFAFTLAQSWRDRLKLVGIGILPALVAIGAGAFAGQLGVVKVVSGMAHLEYPLTMKFFLGNQDTLYVFIFLYASIMFYLYIHPHSGFENLTRFGLYVMLTFFATSYFHPHYLLWMIPFTVFFIDVPRFLPVFGVQLAAWIVYMFQWGRALAGYLLASLSPAFFWSLNSPGELIGRFYPADQFVGLGRSVFSAAALALIYIVWKDAGGAWPVGEEPAEAAAQPLVDEVRS